MSRKPKTHFFAQIDDQEWTMLSVEDRADKGIVIKNFSSSYVTFGAEKVKKDCSKNNHISVHECSNTPNVLITNKQYLINGGSKEESSLIVNCKDHLLWHIFSRRVPLMENEKNLHRPQNKDNSVQIAKFSSSRATLSYSVFVSRPSFDLRSINADTFNIYKADFTTLSIIILSCYINLPTFHIGDLRTSSTAFPILGGEPHPKKVQDFRFEGTSLTSGDLVARHRMAVNQMSDMMINRVHAEVPKIPIEQLHTFAKTITKQPLLQ